MVAISSTPHRRQVSFKEDDIATVHFIPSIDSEQTEAMFYSHDDYERFRFEQKLEMERELRKQLHSPSFRRATRRSSIDLMMPQASSTSMGPMKYHHHHTPPEAVTTMGRRRPGRAEAHGMALAA